MWLINDLFYNCIYCLTIFWGLKIVSPAINNYLEVRMFAFIGICTLYITLFSTYNLAALIFLWLIVIIIQLLFYTSSSFIASISTLIVSTMTISAGMTSSILAMLVNGKRYDFRIIFEYNDIFLLLAFIFVFVSMVLVFNIIIKSLKNISISAYSREKIIVIGNAIVLLLIFVYKKFFYHFILSNWNQIFVKDNISQRVFLGISSLLFLVMALVVIFLLNLFFVTATNLKRIKIKAEVDPLTGALSRGEGLMNVKSSMLESRLEGTDLTLCFIDINDLKVVNDKLGHNEGDNLITSVCKVIKKHLGDDEFIARLGGDEFVLVFTKSKESDALLVWQKILDGFLKLNLSNKYEYRISVSAGFVQYDHKIHKTVSSFIEDADQRMYKNKQEIKKNR